MDVEKFLRDKKLKRIPIDKEKVTSSLRIAGDSLKEAEKLFTHEFYKQTVLAAYTSMFHAARSLLYQDGIQEKSHYAVYIYLREKRKEIPENLVESFLGHQKERKELLYGFDFQATMGDAERAILDAQDFLSLIRSKVL
jgi:uncharacterized protein (UPF0332 family)